MGRLYHFLFYLVGALINVGLMCLAGPGRLVLGSTAADPGSACSYTVLVLGGL